MSNYSAEKKAADKDLLDTYRPNSTYKEIDNEYYQAKKDEDTGLMKFLAPMRDAANRYYNNA